MSFVDHVRRSKTRHPTQQGFSLTKWQKDHARLRTNDADDRLCESGKILFEELSAVRTALGELPPVRGARGARLLTGAVNCEYKVTTNAMMPPDANGGLVFANELVERILDIGPSGSPVKPIAAIEGIVNAFRFPYALADTLRGSGEPTMETLRQMLQLSVTYDLLEQLWLLCLWEDWKLERTEQCVLGTPQGEGLWRETAAAQHRVELLLQEYTTHTSSMLQDPSDRRLLKAVANTEVRVRLDARGRMRTSPYRWDPESPETFPVQCVAAAAAEELYWNELLVEPLPQLGQLTVRQLLSLWKVIAGLGAAASDALPDDTDETRISWLASRFGVIVGRQDLVKALVDRGVKRDQAANVLNLFTMPRDVRVDPWLKPLVPVGNDLAVLVPVAQTANLIRLIEHWMLEGGLDLGRRGDLFEEYVRHELSGMTAPQRARRALRVAPLSLDFDGEQIDCAFRIGDLVVVGECKCCLFPTSPLDRFGVRRTLQEAADQARRKANAVRADVARFVADAKLGPPGANMSVQPLVISNLPHAPRRTGDADVAITDVRLLRRYINEGFSDFFVITGKDLPQPKVGKKLMYYENADEMERHFPLFVHRPPLLEAYTRAVRPNAYWHPLPPKNALRLVDAHVDAGELPNATVVALQEWERETSALA